MPSFKRAVGITFITQVFNFGIPFLTFPLLTRALGINSYGIWIEANTVVSLCVTFTAVGLSNAATALTVTRTQDRNPVYSNVLYLLIAVCGGLGLLVFWGAPVLNQIVIRQPEGVPLLRIVALLVLTMGFNQLATQMFRLFNQPGHNAFFDIILALVRLAAVVFAYFQHDLIAFALVFILLQFVFTLIQMGVIFRAIHLSRPSLTLMKQIIRLSVNLAVVSQANWFVMFGDRLLLSILSTNADVALYSAAYQITLVLSIFGIPFLYPLLPVLGELWKAGDRDGIQALVRRSIRYIAILLIPAVTGLVLVARPLLTLLATPEFAQNSPIVGIIAVGVALDIICVNLQYLLQVQGHASHLRRIYVQVALFNILCNLVVIPLSGSYGAAVTTLLTFCLAIFLVWRKTAYPLTALFDFGTLWRCALASTIMAVWLVLMPVSDLPTLVFAIGTASIIYGISLLLLKVITWNQLSQMLPVKL